MKKYIIIMLILVSTLLVNGTSISASSNENVDYYFYQKDNKDYFKLEKKITIGELEQVEFDNTDTQILFVYGKKYQNEVLKSNYLENILYNGMAVFFIDGYSFEFIDNLVNDVDDAQSRVETESLNITYIKKNNDGVTVGEIIRTNKSEIEREIILNIVNKVAKKEVLTMKLMTVSDGFSYDQHWILNRSVGERHVPMIEGNSSCGTYTERTTIRQLENSEDGYPYYAILQEGIMDPYNNTYEPTGDAECRSRYLQHTVQPRYNSVNPDFDLYKSMPEAVAQSSVVTESISVGVKVSETGGEVGAEIGYSNTVEHEELVFANYSDYSIDERSDARFRYDGLNGDEYTIYNRSVTTQYSVHIFKDERNDPYAYFKLHSSIEMKENDAFFDDLFAKEEVHYLTINNLFVASC